MKNHLSVTHNNKILELSWSNIELLKQYYVAQTARKMYSEEEMKDNEKFLIKFNEIANRFFLKTTELIPYIDNVKTVVDIGSGVALFDLLMSQHWTEANFYLVDKSAWTVTNDYEYWSAENKHGFYNSWDIVTDCIKTSNLDSDKFKFLEPTNEFPESIDFVISTFSWMYHYPMAVYWDKIFPRLSNGGYLVVDILNNEHEKVNEISDMMNSKPTVSYNPYLPNYTYKNNRILETGIHSGRYCWVKNK
jgi:hypothetical protein